jgi:hypothetical protein
MQKKFTFATITYNHQDYILEHLESIKFQILNFGQEFSNFFVLCDDGSTDLTIKITQLWLQSNHNLFFKYYISSNQKNKGINFNFLKCINFITTKQFKILAGDDLYYNKSVYNTNLNSDLTFSPLIKYDGTQVNGYSKVDRLLIFQNNFVYSKFLSIGNVFNSPGAFIKLKLLKDSNLKMVLSKYKYLEDYPLWFYLFNTHKNLKVEINLYPLIIYRNTSGISNNLNQSLNAEFTKDIINFKRMNRIPTTKLQLYMSIYKYLSLFITLYLKLPYFLLPNKIKLSNKIISDEIIKSKEYISIIKKSSKDFIEKSSFLV